MTGKALDGAKGSPLRQRMIEQVLNRARWDPRDLARRLVLLLVARLAGQGPIIIGLDDTIERRWGARINARGIYRDPVRSSHGHFVKTSGLLSTAEQKCTAAAA